MTTLTQPSPRILLSDCSDPPMPDFVLPGLLAGTVGLVVGQGAIGKSFLALQIGIGVALGQPIAAGPAGELFQAPRRGAVAIAFGEDPVDEIMRRASRARKCMSASDVALADSSEGLHLYSTCGEDMRVVRRDGRGMAQGPWLPRLREIADGKRLVILDPLAFLHDGEENDNGCMTYLMREISRVALATGAGVLVLHHVGKVSADGAGDDWMRARGASGLTTAARVQFDLRAPTVNEAAELGIASDMRSYWLRVAVAKANYVPPTEPAFLSRGEGGLLRRADPTRTPSEKRYGRTEC